MSAAGDTEDAGASIDARIAALGDWRGPMQAALRHLIRQPDPRITEALKWRKPSNPSDVPVWLCAGILCTGETYRNKVKLTFAQGAALPDPAGLFNATFDAGARRAIDLRGGDEIDAAALASLIVAAVAFNTARG